MSSHFKYGANVQANGIRQHYLRFGGADAQRAQFDPVVIVPGITSPAITWAFVGERLGRYFDIYILDIRGRGLSESGDHLDYGLDAQAADVIGFAQALELNSYSVLGHSMGARIAIRAARSAPPGMKRIALVDPPVSGPGRRAYPSKLPWYVDSIRQSIEGMSAEQMRQYCPTWTDEQLRLRAEWLHTCDERAVVQSFNGFHDNDIHQDIPHIDVPALLMAAARGDVILDVDVDEIRSLAPHIEFTRVPDAGHMIPWDNEPGFYAALGAFLGRAVD